MKKKDSSLYNKIISLPFITNENKFEDILEDVFDSEDVSDSQKDYLEEKLKGKELWAKCYLKHKFSGGISTTSRIEGLHAQQKRYMTSNSSLTKLFVSFRKIEQVQFTAFKDELTRHKKISQSQQIALLKEIESVCSEYAFKRILPKFYKSLNYTKKTLRKHNW